MKDKDVWAMLMSNERLEAALEWHRENEEKEGD